MLVDVDDQPSLKDRFIHIEANPNCIPYSPYNTKQSSQSSQTSQSSSEAGLLFSFLAFTFGSWKYLLFAYCELIFLDVLSLHLVSSRVVPPPSKNQRSSHNLQWCDLCVVSRPFSPRIYVFSPGPPHQPAPSCQ